MKLKSFGCSFIFGTDLMDARPDWPDQRASSQTWPALLAADLGYQYCCYAQGGSGNLGILNRLLNQVEKSEPAIFVINWTYIDRFDYRSVDGGASGGNDWEQIRPGCRDQISEIYYRELHSEYRDKITSLMAVNLAVDILIERQISFIMTYIDDLMFDQRFHTEPGMTLLQDRVKPYLKNFQGQDFVTWSKNQGFPISSNNHPLEQAHQTAFDLIRTNIDEWIKPNYNIS